MSQETSDSDQCSIKTQITNDNNSAKPETTTTTDDIIINPPSFYDVSDPEAVATASTSTRPTTSTAVGAASSSSSFSSAHRPSFLDLRGQQQQQQRRNDSYKQQQSNKNRTNRCCNNNKTTKAQFQYSIESEETIIIGDCHRLHRTSNVNGIVHELSNNNNNDNDELPNEPTSMPPQLGSGNALGSAFSYKNPAYQSANPACGIQTEAAVNAAAATNTSGTCSNGKSKTSHSSDRDILGNVFLKRFFTN